MIKHEIPGRIRIHVVQARMSARQADTLLYYLNSLEYVTQATVYERTADACVCFTGKREPLIQAIKKFRYESVTVPEAALAASGRTLSEEYKEKLVCKVAGHYVTKLFLPYPMRAAWTVCKSLPYFFAGLKSLSKRNIPICIWQLTGCWHR